MICSIVGSHRSFLAHLKLAACLAALSASAAYGAGTDLIVGVGTHFGQGRTDLDGFFSWVDPNAFSSLRDEMYWSDVEQEKGSFALGSRSQRTFEAVQRAKTIGMQPLLILSYGNQLYEGGTQPSTSDGRTAFARYAGWAAKTTARQVDLFEIWNEWNIGAGNRPPARYGDPANYVELTRAAYKSIKQANANAMVLGGALGDDLPNWPWLSKAIDAGLLDTVDGISVHLYNYSAPVSKAGAAEFVHRLNLLNRLLKEKAKAKSIPIYVTEVGWPNDSTPNGVSARDAAVQGQIFLLEAHGIPNLKGIWFYEFKDGGRDPLNKEHHFGLTHIEGRDKPLACVIKRTQSDLKDASLTWQTTTDGITNQLYTKANGQKILAVWPTRQPFLSRSTTQPISGYFPVAPETTGSETCIADNTSSVAKFSKSELTLELTDTPLILLLPPEATVKRGDLR